MKKLTNPIFMKFEMFIKNYELCFSAVKTIGES